MLSIKLILFLLGLSTVHAQNQECWERYEHKGYRGLTFLADNDVNVCKSYCYLDHNCNIMVTVNDSKCYYESYSEGFDKKKVYNQTDHFLYKLKDSCGGRQCWKYDGKCYKNLKTVNTYFENVCKLTCMETKGCGLADVTGRECRIQTERSLEVQEGRSCDSYILTYPCKKEDKWFRYEGKSYTDLKYGGELDLIACRKLCVSFKNCTMYMTVGTKCYYQDDLRTVSECDLADDKDSVVYIMNEDLKYSSFQ